MIGMQQDGVRNESMILFGDDSHAVKSWHYQNVIKENCWDQGLLHKVLEWRGCHLSVKSMAVHTVNIVLM